MHLIPEIFSQRILRIYGEQGKRWLSTLPEKISWAEEQWELKVSLPFELSYNYAAPVVFSNDTQGVLKICVRESECGNEVNILKYYEGTPMCKLFEYDLDQGILLLEKLEPGKKLTSIDDEASSVKIASSLIMGMKHARRLIPSSFLTISDLAAGIENLRQHYKGGAGPFPEPIVQKVESLFPELISSQTNQYLLHGDFHHDNILRSREEWKLIDPKGVVGEMEYELIPFLMNHLPPNGLEQIIDNRILQFQRELNIIESRTYGWGLCHSLLAAWWNIEDNLQVSAHDLAILCHFHAKTA